MKKTTLPIAPIRNSMLPICSTKEAMKAASDWVRVSQAEFANACVDGPADLHAVRPRRDAHGVPARRSSAPTGGAFSFR